MCLLFSSLAISWAVWGLCAREYVGVGLYGVWVEYLQGLGEVNCPDQSIDLFVPDIMAEYDEGGVDACHEGQGGDEVPEVGHSVMNLDN